MEKSNKSRSVILGPIQLIVIALLIVGAYYIGTLKAKVDFLQGGYAGAGANQPAAAQPQQPQQPQQPLTADAVPKPNENDYVKGNKNAQIAMIEYSDLECPFCKQFHPTAQQTLDTYKDKVMWVFRQYPLPFHQNAQKEAEAALCVGSVAGNDAFWKFTDTVFQRTQAGGTGFALDAIVPLVREIGVNEGKFKDCFDTGKMTPRVKDEMDGGTKVGVSGTPGTILLNVKTGKTRLIPGAVPFDSMKTEIDALLK